MPGEFQELLEDLEAYRRDRFVKAIDWGDEDREADLERLRGIDQEIAARPRRDNFDVFKALDPATRDARLATLRGISADLADVTRDLAAMQPDRRDVTRATLTKALTPGYFASAWRTLAGAETAGEATPETIAKARDVLHTAEYTTMMQDVGDGFLDDARDHLRILASTGAFASPEHAARIEHSINNPPPRSMLKARTPTLTRNPPLAEIVLADAWGAIPPAAHQR